jgi:oxazoline/thiazoline synthase
VRPALKSCFRVEVVEPDGIYLLAASAQHLLRGAVYCKLAPYLDGSARLGDIADRLAEEIDPAEVYYAVSVLESRGLVVDGESRPDPVAAYWEALGQDAETARSRIAAAGVQIVALAGTDAPAQRLGDMLTTLGIVQDPAGSLAVVIAENYLQPQLSKFNSQSLQAGRPWLLVKPVGVEIWIGPLFRPGTTGCWECLAQRLRGQRRIESYIQRRRGLTDPVLPPPAALPSTVEMALQLAATQVAQHLAGHATAAEGAVVAVDLATLCTSRHPLTRRPQCPACGTPRLANEPTAIRLNQRIGRVIEEGRHGTSPPAATLARYQHHISPITGAVSGLHALETGCDLPHVYLSGHNFAFPAHDLRSLRRGLRSSSGGKGATEDQARASALCEALERYSGVRQGDEPCVRASYRELGSAAVHPARCLLFSETQYANRAVWNARDSQFSRVPAPFDEATRLPWTPAWSLTEDAPRHVLMDYCYFGHRRDAGAEVYCWADSNGCAAGNTIEEAILHGFLELVERDAVALWWYNRLRRPGVALDSFDSPYLRALAASYARADRELWALDLTSDLGIPVIAAVSRRVSTQRERLLFGFGAHLDPAVALVRAATELNQCLTRATAAGADREDASDFADEDFRSWWASATLAAQSYLTPAPSLSPRRRSDWAAWTHDDLLEAILHCRHIVESRGMEVLVLDQTRADIGLPVARVIVPGLRHFWTRFAPGRLYDVPVRTGELPRPLAETELNPIPMFI